MKSMRPKIILILMIGALVLPLLFLEAGCSGEVSFTTAALSNATMCKTVDDSTKAPVVKASEFSASDPIIYCSVKLSNAPDDTEIKAQWIYVQGEAKDLNNYLIDETPVTADGTRYIAFSLPKPTSGWPKGEYLVKLFVDGKENVKVNFKVI